MSSNDHVHPLCHVYKQLLLEKMYNQIVAMHPLTGCDTTSYPINVTHHGFNVLQKHDIVLEYFGEGTASKNEIIAAGSKFFSYLTWIPSTVSMSSLRCRIFVSHKTTPLIKSLSHTDEALAQHCLWCHLLIEWVVPTVAITDWEWELKDGIHFPVIDIAQVAQADLPKFVASSCASDKRCFIKG